MATPLRLGDLLASVSLVSDLGFGLPPEESMRATIVGTALGRRLGLTETEVADVFYTSLLQHLGCTGFAHETAAVYGDELVLNAAAARSEPAAAFLRAISRGRRPTGTARVVLYTLVRGTEFARRFATARCEVGRETARRLGLSDGVQRGLAEVAESWDGSASPFGLRGEAIAPAARIAAVAATVARFDAIGGHDGALAAVRERSGSLLDPGVVAAFEHHGAQILAELDDGDPRDVMLAAEPRPIREVAADGVRSVAAAIGDVADLKSTYTLGHSSGVAALAVAGAHHLRLPDPAGSMVEVAGLLHDVGRVGVSATIWERRGPLTAADWEQVRLHPYHSERILARSEALRPLAAIAGRHHERLDGSGYHRGDGGRDLGPEARLLAAADAFAAMTEDRPHRPAFAPDAAADRLHDEVGAGRIDGPSAAAVLAAAGLRARDHTGASRPAGLSEREVEVLRLVARGLSNREIADRLVVSPRTAEHHVQHIYTKIGSSSRAAAALFAMEHRLLDEP